MDRPHDVDRRRLRPRPRSSVPTAPPAATSSRRRGTTPSRRSRRTASGSCSGTRAPTARADRSTAATPASTSCRPTARRAPRLVREGGTEPSFDATGKRVFVNDFRQGKAVLVSVGIGDPDSPLSGGDDVVHFQSDNATQIVPSPDGKWVAFAERWHAFVAPFPHTGRPIDLEPDDGGLSDGAHLAGRGLQHPLVGRQPPRPLVDGPGSLHARSRQDLHVPRRESADAGSAGSEGHEHQLHRAGRRARPAPSRWSAPGSSPRRATRIENGTVVVEGNRITAVGRGVADPGRREADRRPRQDDHAGHHRRARPRRRRRGRHPRAGQLAARRPTSPSA